MRRQRGQRNQGPHGKLGRHAARNLRCRHMPSTETVSTIGRYQAGEAATCAVVGQKPDAVAELVYMRQIDLTNRDRILGRERVPKKARQNGPIEACIGVVKRQADQRAAVAKRTDRDLGQPD